MFLTTTMRGIRAADAVAGHGTVRVQKSKPLQREGRAHTRMGLRQGIVDGLHHAAMIRSPRHLKEVDPMPY